MAAIETTVYRSKMNLQLSDTRKWLSASLRIIKEAVIAVNIKGQIMYMNHNAEDLTGWNCKTTENATINHVFDLIDQYTNKRVDVLRRIFHATETHNPVTLTTRTGDNFAIRDRHTTVTSDNGDVIGAVIIFRKTTTFKDCTTKLQ